MGETELSFGYLNSNNVIIAFFPEVQINRNTKRDTA